MVLEPIDDELQLCSVAAYEVLFKLVHGKSRKTNSNTCEHECEPLGHPFSAFISWSVLPDIRIALVEWQRLLLLVCSVLSRELQRVADGWHENWRGRLWLLTFLLHGLTHIIGNTLVGASVQARGLATALHNEVLVHLSS